NAGADQSVSLPTSKITLSGTVNNVNDIIAASWTKKSGGTATIVNPHQGAVSPVVTEVNGLVSGVYVFTLVVKDKIGKYYQDDVQVTVNAAASTPAPAPSTGSTIVLNAGADQTITLPNNKIKLSGSINNISNVVATSWVKKSGGSATILTPHQAAINPVATEVNGLVTGAYVFTLVVKDKNSRYYQDDVQVIVKASESATLNPVAIASPVPNAGNDKTIWMPIDYINLSGTITNIENVVAASWTKKSGSTATIIEPHQGAVTPVNTLVTGLQAGAYVFTLVIKDKNGAYF